MTTPTMKSQPVYPPLAWDATGRRHLLVAADPVPDWLNTLGPCPGPLEIIGPAVLADRLAVAHMGVRLYLVGDEAMLWLASKAAMAAGLGEAEIRRHRTGTLARPVWCVHCQHVQAGVTTNVVTCGGCGRSLFVRDHFSRRLGAYMGVMVDAEVPGELPAVETVYP